MSDIETVINASKQIEKMLELRMGASGRGLHEKTSSVEHRLPQQIVKRIRFIASVRNAVVHGDTPMIRDRAGFESAVQEVTTHLRSAVPARESPRPQPEPGTGRRYRRRGLPLLPLLLIMLATGLYVLIQGFN